MVAAGRQLCGFSLWWMERAACRDSAALITWQRLYKSVEGGESRNSGRERAFPYLGRGIPLLFDFHP